MENGSIVLCKNVCNNMLRRYHSVSVKKKTDVDLSLLGTEKRAAAAENGKKKQAVIPELQ